MAGLGANELLARYPNNRELAQYIDEILSCGAFDLDESFLGFLDDYSDYASIIQRRIHVGSDLFPGQNYTIVDVGCAAGFQQVFFADCISYIGIDSHLDSHVRPIVPNARFMQGEFSSLIDSGELVITDNMIGIANMSLLYNLSSKRDLELFNQLFTRQFIF